MAHDFVHHYAGIHECRICSIRTADPARTVGACLSKPATQNAPEWKIAPLPQPILELAEMERKARLQACGITDLMRGVSSPSPAPLDLSGCTQQAMADFTARRKAKRAVTNTCPTTAEPFDLRPRWAVTNDELARALSTPLPHDPPMSVRLMPWRGKE